ncbi:hypothetical protein ACFOFO_06210 [Undibacterium arcticum]|uniref:Aspartate kinase n=1 Tax=Undibacterium arcticum TaxID=1762892 RepID=A0ABV7EY33_9BURK
MIESAFLTEGMMRGLLNLSELARHLRPQLERDLWKPVGQAAVVMALTRLALRLQQNDRPEVRVLPKVGELITRSELTEFTYTNSDTSYECQRHLLAMAESHPGVFVTVTQGMREVLVISGRSMVSSVESCFGSEQLLLKKSNLSALTLRLTPDSKHTPGIFHSILKQLAWRKINLVNMICSYTELTIFLEQSEMALAFSVLSHFA